MDKSIHVHFHHFWPGFIEGNNPNTVQFFIELFRRVFETEHIIVEPDYNKATILCENAGSAEHSLIDAKKWDYSILFTGESVVSFGGFSDHYYRFSCFLSGLETSLSLKRVQCPLLISYVLCNPNKWREPLHSVPRRMACAVIANPKGMIRTKFLDKLEEKMSIVYAGSFRNNIGFCVGGDHNSDELINFIRGFRFVITMENNKEDYYITEKVCNGLFAGTIPVYWGSPHIDEYINEERILWVRNESDEEMEKIIDQMVHMTNEEYMKKIQSNIFKNVNMIEKVVADMKVVLGI